MIIVSVELKPPKGPSRLLARMLITNDGTSSDLKRGNYLVRLIRKGTEDIAVTVTLAAVLGPNAEHMDSTRWRKLHSARERLLDAMPEVVRRYVEHVVDEAGAGRDAP